MSDRANVKWSTSCCDQMKPGRDLYRCECGAIICVKCYSENRNKCPKCQATIHRAEPMDG